MNILISSTCLPNSTRESRVYFYIGLFQLDPVSTCIIFSHEITFRDKHQEKRYKVFVSSIILKENAACPTLVFQDHVAAPCFQAVSLRLCDTLCYFSPGPWNHVHSKNTRRFPCVFYIKKSCLHERRVSLPVQISNTFLWLVLFRVRV